jgi:hypothetical protein
MKIMALEMNVHEPLPPIYLSAMASVGKIPHPTQITS